MELTSRMNGYQALGPSQSTNIRINVKIKELLLADQVFNIDIYILVDDGQLKYRDCKINLAAGLEDRLIFQINPPSEFFR